MRDTARQLADRFHLLRLAQVVFDALALDRLGGQSLVGTRQLFGPRRHLAFEARPDGRQLLGPCLELGIEGHDPAVRLCEFAVEALGFLIPLGKLGQALEQFAMLSAKREERAFRARSRYALGQDRGLRTAEGRTGGGKAFRENDHRFTGPGLHLEAIHEAASPHHAAPETRCRSVAAVEHGRQSFDARADVGDPDHQGLPEPRTVHPIFGPAAAGIAIGVTRDLTDRRRDPHLILRAETKPFGEPPRALAHCDDVVFGFDQGRDDGPFHDAEALATKTVASSRMRVKSRYRIAATRLG